MHIGNRAFTRTELLRRVGNISQIGGTRHCTLAQGRAKGLSAIDVDTGGGLCFTVLPDRTMDISSATYRGVNLVYRTPTGEVHPSYYEPEGGGWLRTFFGGLLTTCGLTTIGGAGMDGDEKLGVHGRASTTPAWRVNDLSRWEGDDYIIELVGQMDDAVLFGDKLRHTRRMYTRMGTRTLMIEDTVENVGYRPSPFTILYHINPGFPLLDATSRVLVSATQSTPYDDVSSQGMEQMLQCSAPVAGWREQNFLHRVAAGSDGWALAALINPDLGDGLGLALRFDRRSLPYLSHWKMVGEGDYVVALEPCNAPCANRAELRKQGLLPVLAPGEARSMHLELSVLDGAADIDDFQQRVEAIVRKAVQ